MAILKVARMGHPVLRAKARAVEPAEIVSPGFQALIDDLFATMREYQGIGLAAPQVHESVRLFVAGLRTSKLTGTLSDDDEMPFIALINPVITPVIPPGAVSPDTDTDWEGCLSIPDIRGLVERPRSISVRAFNRQGRKIELEASGLPARVIQHETDHLDGILFFDRMKSLDTLTFLDEYSRFHRKNDGDDDDE